MKKNSFVRFRNDIGWKLENKDCFRFIPFRKAIGSAIQSKESKAALKELGDGLKQSFGNFEKHKQELADRSLSAKHWLAREQCEKLPGSDLVAMDAVQTMLYVFGTYEAVADLFDRYLVNHETFEATMIFFLQLPRRLEEEGWMVEGRWGSHVIAEPADYEPIVSLYIAREWATVLVKAAPQKWDIDAIIGYVKSL